MGLFDLFRNHNEDLHTEMEMASLFVNRKRIKAEDLIRVQDGQIVDGEPTHKVLGCWGNIANTSLGLTLINLGTNEPSTLKLK
jgi:hypothetical protein